ncbi:hypothetical protein HDU76_002404, partial [Blyttiomyces sp. JEL0837]
IIVCPPLVYGMGTGLFKTHSSQVPKLISVALKRRKVEYVGLGVSKWSHVHVQDLATVYMYLVSSHVSKTPPPKLNTNKAPYVFAENGAFSWKSLADAIASHLHKLNPTYLDSPLAAGFPEDKVMEEALGSGFLSGLYFGSNAVCKSSLAHEWGWKTLVGDKISLEDSLKDEVTMEMREKFQF